jgi:hypothetical protein
MANETITTIVGNLTGTRSCVSPRTGGPVVSAQPRWGLLHRRGRPLCRLPSDHPSLLPASRWLGDSRHRRRGGPPTASRARQLARDRRRSHAGISVAPPRLGLGRRTPTRTAASSPGPSATTTRPWPLSASYRLALRMSSMRVIRISIPCSRRRLRRRAVSR